MNSGLKCASAPARPARDVRGHDQHGVLEVDRAALAVGQAAVVHHLQQHVEDVGVRLLDLVEQHDAVGPAADRLGELAALVVADVAGRRADQARHGVLLHVLRHVDADHRVLGVEHELGQRAGQLGLADAGRAEEQERADRAVGVAAGRRASGAARCADRGDRLVLADDALVQALLHVDELLDLALHQAGDRDAGPAATTSATSSAVTSSWRKPASRAVARPRASARRAALELGDLAVAQLGGALRGRRRARRARARGAACSSRSLTLADAARSPPSRPATAAFIAAELLAQLGELALDRLAARGRRPSSVSLASDVQLDLELHDAALDLVDLGRHRVDLDAQPRGGLVDQVDRLVGQEAVGDVAVRERRGGDQRASWMRTPWWTS